MMMMMMTMLMILKEFLPLQDRGNCKNFTGSAALVEVCDLLVLLVYIILLFKAHLICYEVESRDMQCLISK